MSNSAEHSPARPMGEGPACALPGAFRLSLVPRHISILYKKRGPEQMLRAALMLGVRFDVSEPNSVQNLQILT